jgi:hypothetical protein
VATSLETRVERLEHGTGGRCPECGFDGDWRKVRFRVEQGRGKGKPEHCDTCGRPKRIVLTWGDKA